MRNVLNFIAPSAPFAERRVKSTKNYIYNAPTGDGITNVARDSYFLKTLKKDEMLLYFYVNSNAVIIGRNQNAWRECNLSAMAKDGAQLVRRHTGGGAVFHDCGNLNFSFITNEKHYNLKRQLGVILNAAAKFGIKAELSGRNDILINGRKFSGSAYGFYKGNRSHHGTLLVKTDLDKLNKYLNVSVTKLKSKGIASARSRVCNLSEYAENITVENLRRLITECFIEEYGETEEYQPDEKTLKGIQIERETQASWDWRLGKSPEFEICFENRFSFGETQLFIKTKNGFIAEAKVFSDALDIEIADEISNCLTDCKYDRDAICGSFKKMNDRAAASELISYFAEAKEALNK